MKKEGRDWMSEKNAGQRDSLYESRDEMFMDIDRMVNEGLGGGIVSTQNGLIEETSTDTMKGVSSDDT
jgi:hypothetical protein